MIHHTSSSFWKCYYILPDEIQTQADQHFDLLKVNPSHLSLHIINKSGNIGQYVPVENIAHQELMLKMGFCGFGLVHTQNMIRLFTDKSKDSTSLDEASVAHLAQLPPLHRDPFDRMLVCQAQVYGLKIVTVDDVIPQYPVQILN